jgi:hypothetical protein
MSKSTQPNAFVRHRSSYLLLLLLALPGSLAVHAASEDAVVVVEVVSTISLINQSGMVFGDIAASNSPGTVVLSPTGSRLVTGGTFINSTVASGPAAFDVSGLPNAVYAITLPSTVTLTGASGNSMVVDNFTSLPANTGLTDPGGEQDLFVGATLNVDSNQAVGSYSGQMTVTVVYN